MTRRVVALRPIVYAVTASFFLTLACGKAGPQVSQPGVGEGSGASATAIASPIQGQPTEVPSQPNESPPGSTRSNPAPRVVEVTIDNMTLLVAEPVIAGGDVVHNGNRFNPTPEPESRCVLVSMTARCNRRQDQPYKLPALSLKLVDSSGVVHDPSIFPAGMPGQLEAGEFFDGAQKSGYVVFLVPEGDNARVFKYEALFLGGEACLSVELAPRSVSFSGATGPRIRCGTE